MPELLESLELLDESELLEEPEEPEEPEESSLPEELAEPEPECAEPVEPERLALPESVSRLPDGVECDALPVPGERFATEGCAEPGSVAATAPATTTLAKLTVAVVALRRRLPRSRSATACETSRGALACGRSLRNSGLFMLSVWHTRL